MGSTPAQRASGGIPVGSEGPGDAWRGRSVLIVDADASYSQVLESGLAREGFLPRVEIDPGTALRAMDEVGFDLVILDLVLPPPGGLDLCTALRARSDVPIIVLTSRGAEVDAVVALELGADDFIRKPFRLRELMARARAVLRRGRPAASGQPLGVIEVGSVRLDSDSHEVKVGGNPVYLPVKEFQLLERLLANAGRVVARTSLIASVWGEDSYAEPNVLDVHIRRLRGLIEADPSRPKLVTTVRGVGYRFEVPAAERQPELIVELPPGVEESNLGGGRSLSGGEPGLGLVGCP